MNPGSNSKLLAVIDGGPVGDLIREFGTELQGLGIVIVSAVVIALGIKLAASAVRSDQHQGGGGLRQTVGSLGTVIIAILLIGAAFIVVPILFSTVGA